MLPVNVAEIEGAILAGLTLRLVLEVVGEPSQATVDVDAVKYVANLRGNKTDVQFSGRPKEKI